MKGDVVQALSEDTIKAAGALNVQKQKYIV